MEVRLAAPGGVAWRSSPGARPKGATWGTVAGAARIRTRRLAAVSAIGIGCLVVDLSALMAHLLELPNKLTLAGPLWLAIQQQLYRSWGPVLGPFEVGAVVSAWVLVWLRRGRPGFRSTLLAAGALTTMLGLFFAVVEPVNVAVAGWTADALPPDWSSYRLRWELGHAVRTLLAVVGLALLIRVKLGESRHPPVD